MGSKTKSRGGVYIRMYIKMISRKMFFLLIMAERG